MVGTSSASTAMAQWWSTRAKSGAVALFAGALLLLLAGAMHLDRNGWEVGGTGQGAQHDGNAVIRSGKRPGGVLRSSVAASLTGIAAGIATDELQLIAARNEALPKAPLQAPHKVPFAGRTWPSRNEPAGIPAESPRAHLQDPPRRPDSSHCLPPPGSPVPPPPPSQPSPPPLPPPFLTPQAQLIQTCNTTGVATIALSANRTGKYTWKGWGTSLCWMGNYIGNYPAAQLDEFLDLLFSPSRGLGLGIVRYNIGGGFNASNSPQFLVVRPEMYRGMPGFRPGPHAPYDWAADANQRKVLFGARARGAHTFIAFSNSPPWWMTHSGDVAGGANNGSAWNLKAEYYQGFAEYLADVVLRYATSSTWNLTFQYLDPVNEPSNGWRAGNFQEGCAFSPANLTRLMPLVAAALSARNLSTRLIGWDLPSAEDLDTYMEVPRQSIDLLALFQHHMYLHKPQAANKTRAALARAKQVMDQFGKETWMSEWGPDGADGTDMGLATYLARVVIESVNLMGASAWIYWQPIDSTPKWTLIKTPWYAPFMAGPTLRYTLGKKYFVLKQFAHLVPPGSINLRLQSSADCDHCVAAFFVPARSYVAVLVVNHLATAYRLTLTISGFVPAGGGANVEVRTYRTSESEDFALLGSLPANASGPVELACAGQSVTTFIIANLTKA